MKIHLRLPTVQCEPTSRPDGCPACGHWHLQRHGVIHKPIRDQQFSRVLVDRYRCVHCRHTFRHYPQGVTRADHSQRLVALLAIIWALGLSLRRTALVLSLLGLPTSFVSVWRAVQTVGAGVRRPSTGPVTVLGVDGTGMRLAGATTGVVVAVDMGSGQVLDLVLADERDPQALLTWLRPLAESHGIEVLVTDDLASYQVVAEHLGLERHGCHFHLLRWVGRALADLERQLGDDWQPTLAAVRTIVRQGAADGDAQLLEIWHSLQDVPHGRAGTRTPETRLWLLTLRLSERWHSYRVAASRADVPPTNNRTEQAIGRLKIRSRTVRGYKSVTGLLHGCALAAVVGTGQTLDLTLPLTTP
jgi:transposase-like protein